MKFVLPFCVVSLPASAQLRDSSEATQYQIITNFMRQNQVPGVAYVILQNGQVVSRGALGVSDITTREPITIDSVFPIASLSKPFVALGILYLHVHGQLDIHKPVGTYLPDLPSDWKPIPLIRMLDHTSGIPDHYNAGIWDVIDQTPISSDEVVAHLVTLPLEFPAGEKYKYSNGNYLLLAKIIEKVSGQPYDQFLADKVFHPLGMTGAKALKLEDLPKVVHGYYRGNDRKAYPAPWNPDWCFGNGALGMSVNDLAKLDAGLYTDKIIDKETLKSLTEQQPLNDGKKPGYAMGWVVGRSRGAAMVSHQGKVNGWRSTFGRYPKYGLTVIVLINSGTPNIGALAADLAGTIIPDLSLATIEDDQPELSKADRTFLEAIKAGTINETWLDEIMTKDYETKEKWKGLRELLTKQGEVTLLQVTRRKRKNGNVESTYRLEQGDNVLMYRLSRNAEGKCNGLYITS